MKIMNPINSTTRMNSWRFYVQSEGFMLIPRLSDLQLGDKKGHFESPG